MYASGTIFLTVSALIYTIITIILFSTKKKVNKLENRLFKRLLLLSVLSMITELLIVLTNNILYIGTIIQKLFLVFIVLWLSRFMDYTFAITRFDSKKSDAENIKKYKGIYYIFLMANVVCSLLIMIAPISFNDIGTAKYTSGLSVDIVFLITAIYMIIMFILLIANLKTVKKKKCLPIIILLVLLVMTAIIQNFNPQILLTNAVFGLVICIMYHTIENPDLKLITQLELAKDQADRANRAKSDFLSSMSHEIRTPLNAVIGSAQLLELEDLSTEGKDALRDLINSSNHLLEIGSGILNISQIESGKMELVEKQYSPIEAFDELYNMVKGRIGDKPIEFEKKYADDIPSTLYGDKSKIKEIIINLLTNSIKFTEQGKILFEVKCINNKEKCNLIISVSDTGCGIRKEMMDKLYEKFARDEEVMNSTIEGVGLGLAITKNLVELMDGKITLNSIVGQGTTFIVSLPQRIVSSNTTSLEENKEVLASVDKKASVLIVDDSLTNLKIEQRHLQYFGLVTEICNSGEECIEKIKQGKKYDVILMDDMMPNLSGTETMLRLKEEYDYKNPIIVLTANAIVTQRDEYLTKGFDDFISKPVSREKLYEVVKKYL